MTRNFTLVQERIVSGIDRHVPHSQELVNQQTSAFPNSIRWRNRRLPRALYSALLFFSRRSSDLSLLGSTSVSSNLALWCKLGKAFDSGRSPSATGATPLLKRHCVSVTKHGLKDSFVHLFNYLFCLGLGVIGLRRGLLHGLHGTLRKSFKQRATVPWNSLHVYRSHTHQSTMQRKP